MINTTETTETNHALEQAKAQLESITEMVERLQHIADCDACGLDDRCEYDADYHNEEDARQTIQFAHFQRRTGHAA